MKWMAEGLEKLTSDSLERTLLSCEPAPGRPGFTVRGERTLLDLSSNDYLGLSGHPAIVEAMRDALAVHGTGASASRLVTGSRSIGGQLEEAIADWQQSGAALVFGNGYMANVGVISALVGRGDAVFSDRLNHASIVDGISLSLAEHARYRHNDMEHLRYLLSKHRAARRKLIVTDAVFSMDGEHALLDEVIQLKREFGAMLMVDEAHSGGVYGLKGEGLCHSLGLHQEVDVHMGTFSKAFGVYGAYVSGSSMLIRWLLNKARTFVYSTALPPVLLAGIAEALRLVQQEGVRRERLAEASRLFRAALRDAGFQAGDGVSPIIPILVGDSAAALRFSSALEEEGILGVAIRPPAVPAGTARIRFSLSASHTKEGLLGAVHGITRAGRMVGALGL
ncbi:8-amino-7-oxononanoate synthase [Paenibacillus sp. PL2-23]|uniref:8-amino-7-oxononanoate synthase n=1 Tax=Paenibacillus sp. PL2-23 TaxID=2100729 RepID=UPI0030F70AAF